LVRLTLRANAPSQGGAKCGEAIWGERNSEIGLNFGFVIFKIFSREWIKPNAWYATDRSAKGWKAAIRSTRLNETSAPKTDIPSSAQTRSVLT
jgi:hypothetical protein